MSQSLYGHDFYNSQIYGSLQSAQVYLYHLFSIWGVPESVADLGCGRGAWLATCRDLGVRRTVGFDGDWNSQEDMLDRNIEFHPVNLEMEFPLTETFDLAISLEVAEHLQPESSDAFVESLARLSGAVLFSAAFIGQPGANHINNRLHSFWASKFLARGYLPFDLFRPVFWNDDRVEPCYRQNTFIYVKPGHSLHSALVSLGYASGTELTLMDCVHPAVYLGLLGEFNRLRQSLETASKEQSSREHGAVTAICGATPAGPDGVELLAEHAQALVLSNQLGEAAETYRMALSREPNNPECLLGLSHVLLRMKCHEECLHHARHFLRLVSDVSMGYYLAGHAARELGRWSESRDYLGMAVELDPTNVYARVLLCMSSFSICMNHEEAVSAMYAYSEGLDGLIAETPLDTAERVDNAVDGIGALTPFFLPYLGCNVKDLQQKYGSWICRIMAAKYPRFAQPLPQRASAGRIKVGIVSHYFHNHSNWKIPIRGWLEQLDRQLFSIHCYYTGEISDVATSTARAMADSFLQNSDTEALAAAILEQGLDVLIYPGIGMDTATLKLAALRLAPVQCASWGHPVTTGMPTVDYFISSDLMEPPDGHAHYSEKLVRLQNLSIWYDPDQTVKSSNFEMPGLQGQEILFLCSQNLLKYLPQHDFVFPAIAEQVSNARFVFIANPVAELTKRFMARLESAFQLRGMVASDYVIVVPHLNSLDFAGLNARIDIFLDSFEWSGCNTILESLPFSKPIVTLSGTFMRGRHAYAILKMMGIEETIAASLDEYIAIAVRLANDLVWRQSVASRVAENKSRVYRDKECIAGLELLLKKMTGTEIFESWLERGYCCMEEGNYQEAETCFRQANRLAPQSVWILLNLGSALEMQGRLVDAENTYGGALEIDSSSVQAWISLANLFYRMGRIDQAESGYRQAILINPEYDKSYYNLGILLSGQGRVVDAEEAYRQAVTVNPGHDRAWYNLGVLCKQQGRFEEAREAFNTAIAISPDNSDLQFNLGEVLMSLSRIHEAAQAFSRAVALRPGFVEALNYLGIAQGLLCRLDQAVTSFRQAISQKPDFATAHNNLLLTLQYLYPLKQEDTFQEALKFGRFDQLFMEKRSALCINRDPGKKLKIGLMSGNLCDHPVAYFLESALNNLDRDGFSLFAYANQSNNDLYSERLRKHFAQWSMVKDLSDEDLATRIQSDGIDILIDLDGHTAGNRLVTFAYKPAPVQITWLGYPNTTGLGSMDYIFADPVTVPLEEESFYTEKIWRLPDTYICFTPPDADLEVNQLPALVNGYITFGCYNNPVKVSAESITCWAEILRAIPNSVLVIKVRQTLDLASGQCELFRKKFCNSGIDADRLIFEGARSSRSEMLSSYHSIDIALDPFPYNGTTTTCEAAWMGVPTLTIRMPRGIYSHNGELIMKSIGLGDWVSDSVDGYVEKAQKVAADVAKLASLRKCLRAMLLSSPLCDAPQFARNLQTALRSMWQEWCNR